MRDLYARRMSSLPERYFTAADARLRHVQPTWWGAVVTDERFPDVHDLNYARITHSAPDLGLEDVLRDLAPALRDAGSRHVHVVVLDPEGAPRLLGEAERAGHRVSVDSVMEHRGPAPPEGPGVEETDPADPALWDVMRNAYREFELTDERVVRQLLRWNREVLAPAGRRYFLARRDGGVAGMGALHVAAGVAYIDDVVTFPEYRRRGVASAVVRELVREAAAGDADATFLLADGPDPIRLYRSLGFEETGRLLTSLGTLVRGATAPTE
jgi:ribosomal protein S18 acetylase RimI-like enzyme